MLEAVSLPVLPWFKETTKKNRYWCHGTDPFGEICIDFQPAPFEKMKVSFSVFPAKHRDVFKLFGRGRR